MPTYPRVLFNHNYHTSGCFGVSNASWTAVIQADKMQSLERALIPFVLSRPKVDLIRSKLVISLMYSRKLFDTLSVFKFKKIPHLQTRAQVH